MEKGQVFGLNIGELLTIYDRDSQSWKMSECLFTGDYAKYSEALPKSGMMRNGRIYEQATWARRTEGRESGLWRTPAAHDPGVSPERLEPIEGGELGGMNRHFDRHTGRMAQIGLTQQVALRNFPTPHSNCHTGPGKRGKGGENLQTAVKWPTPQQRDWKGKHQRVADPENRDCLPNAAGGQLNPQFVEWLMGYPLNYTDMRDGSRFDLIRGWTDCADSGMRLSLK